MATSPTTTNTWLATLFLRLVLPLVLTAGTIFRPSGISFLYLLLFFYLPFVPVPTVQSLRGHTGRFLRFCLLISFLTVISQIIFQIVLFSLSPYGQFLVTCELTEKLLRHFGLVRFNSLNWIQLVRWVGPDAVALAGTLVTYLVITNILGEGPPSQPCAPNGRTSVASAATAPPPVPSSKPKRPGKGSRFLVSIGPYAVLASLAISSSLEPSIPSAIYYLVFLAGATWWAMSQNLRNRFFIFLFAFLAVFVTIHVTCLFLYQLQWAQEVVGPDTLQARLLGLVPLVLTNCTDDPRDAVFNPQLNWASFVSPLSLLALFHLLIYEVKTLLRPQDDKFYPDVVHVEDRRMSLGGFSDRQHVHRLSRRQTVRWQGGQQQGQQGPPKPRRGGRMILGKKMRSRIVDSVSSLATTTTTISTTSIRFPQMRARHHHRDQNETTPLMTYAPPRRRYSSSGRQYSAEDGATTALQETSMGGGDAQIQPMPAPRVLTRGISIMSRDSRMASSLSPNDTQEPEYDSYGLLVAGLFTLFDLFAKSSYVATNIIMMAWSITYHSWLTFVLLLWACVLWMFPNQRRAMLVSSPGLVIYAELLLLAQYVFSLHLTEDELPESIAGVNLGEIGLAKSSTLACLPILVKSLYTCMFWITLKQFVMELREKKASLENAAQEPFRITVSTAGGTTAPVSELRSGPRGPARPSYMMKIGTFVQDIMTKFWIWVVAIMLFVIGLGGDKVVLYRIVYMALFLVFILTFQLSYRVWRKMMYGFWLTVIVYSMLVLVMIYTYQFKNIPQYLSNYTGIPKQLQTDIGLEKYDTGSLFVRLLTPTFFVVITVVQLHYFHKDFLKLSEMSKPLDRRKSMTPAPSTEDKEPPALIDEFTLTNVLNNLSYYGTKAFEQSLKIYAVVSEIGWRFLEIHIMKIVLFSAFMLSVYDSCAIHFVLFVGVICAMAVTSISVQRLITHICSIYISGLLLAKMIYQIDYIDHEHWATNCTIAQVNVTKNDAEWLGLRKTNHLSSLLKGYVGMILVLTIQAVVHIRQRYQRYMTRMLEPVVGILFPQITRDDADKSILDCLKFLLNYGFYKFGVEITLVTMVVVIGTRLDAFSVLYSFWLIPMFLMSRVKLSGIWLPFIGFVAVLLPIQYMACVGLPPFLCPEYPWESWKYFDVEELKEWLFLPDMILSPKATRLIPDFFLLLFACQQHAVFWIEKNIRQDDFPGGSNEELTEMYLPPSENPIPDFLMVTKTWLDVIKKCIFLSFYWITLAIIFLTGTNRVNLFALGYLVGSFIFLWEGNEFYLRSKRQIIYRWNYLTAFNVFVVFSKSILQLVGCVFASSVSCWLVQLLGIACLKFGDDASAGTMPQGSSSETCTAPQGEAGLMWDGITFAFLLFQRKIFNSHYFYHIRSETDAQAQLASRGAELIGSLMQKQIKQQEEQEKDVLEKIKMKMDRIKATHQKGRPREILRNHFDASSMVSSVSMDEAPIIEPEPPPSPRAPLADPISTVITSGSGPTPTPSSAAMTISVDGFFEPPYGQRFDQRYSLLQPPPLPLSPSDESFPVFSPAPYDHHTTMGRGRMTTAAGVQTSPPQQSRYYTTLNSPALSHHTSIRSGDYYMFDEYDDEDLEMIDSITEEDDEDSDNGKPTGVTISELMASALKTGDVESATEYARQARRASECRGDGSLTESLATSSVPIPRRRSRRRLSRKSYSFRSGDRSRVPLRDSRRDSDFVAPLALDDEEASGAGGDRPGGGGGGGGDDGDGIPPEMQPRPIPEEEPPQPPSPTIMRRLLAYLRFGWAFLESSMVSMTGYMNKFSRDYRHVSRCLAEEKQELKEKELAHPPIFAVHRGHSADQLESSIRRPGSVDFGEEAGLGHVGIDFTKQLSTEESDLGGSGDAGSKDDLQTVVEKPSPIQDRDKDEKFASASMDEVSSGSSEAEYPPLVHLVVAIWYVIISHSDLVCYFVVFLNQMKSASILSLPLPLMVLLWGSLSVPRPTKTFWVTIIAYTEAIVVIKYLFQFDFFPWNDSAYPQRKDPFTPQKILGIEKHGKYAVYDVTLLMVVFFHRFMLKSLGLWKNKATAGHETSIVLAEEEQPIAAATPKISGDYLMDALMGPSVDDGEEGGDMLEMAQSGSSSSRDDGCVPHWDDFQFQESLAYGPTIFKLCVIQYLSSIRTFFNQILNLEYKVKVDVYSYMFMCDFFNFLVLIFGFSAFGSQQSDVASYLEENKVPVPFLVMIIVQFALIVIDRALYLRKYILGKFFYQMFLVTFVHISMFFILPAVTEQEFNAKIPPQTWYMVKCIYLLFSAYQIRSGYPTRILGNFLCKKYNYVNMFLFKGFMAVPFLFELRALMDWIWTDTSMTLSDWLKLEDIFAHVFQLKCQRRVEKEYPQGRGMPKARWSKYAIGGSSLFIIIAIIWFPLVLFALGNTVGLPNRPKEMSIELSIGSYQPIFTMSAQNNSLKNFTPHDYDLLNYFYKGEKTPLYFISGYESEDISVAQFDGNSDAVWGISPPSKEKLLTELKSNESVSIRFSWTIQRETPNPSLGNIVKDRKEISLDPGGKARQMLVDMISGTPVNGTAANLTEVTINGIFPKFLKITNTGKAQVPDQLNKFGTNTSLTLRSLKLKLKGDSLIASERWWDVEEVCVQGSEALPHDDHCSQDHLNMFTFNEKSFPPTLSLISGGGIIGLYTTLVLVASKFVRSFFAGISFLIMFDDMPNVDRLFQLCLDIYLVRESNELALEEDLFAKMIFLYRSPETLIKWTRPKTTPPEAIGDVPALPRA